MSRCLDRWQSRAVDNQPVANAGTVSTPWLLMDGAAGAAIQVLCSGGAAGTVYFDSSNQDGGQAFASPTTQTVAANGSLYLTLGPTDQATLFAQMRVRFVASAAGNVTIATNVRRYYP